MKGLQIKNQGDRKIEVLLYDVIGADFFGDGVTAKSFANELRAAGEVDEINLRINSPGGSVHDGIAIYNTLVNHPARVVVDIDGLAASAASFIAMAGDEIRIAENGVMMIHPAQGMTMGSASDHVSTAAILAKHDGLIAGTYAARAGATPDAIKAIMEADGGKGTWMTAEEAKENKLVDEITPSKRVQACAGPDVARAFGNIPEAAKRFFTAGVSVAPPKLNSKTQKRKAVTAMANQASNQGRNRTRVRNDEGDGQGAEGDERGEDPGEREDKTLADLLNEHIDAIHNDDDDERTRDDVKQQMCDAAGVEPEDVEKVLSGEDEKPDPDHLEAYAGVEGLPSEEDMRAAAGYDPKDDEGDAESEEQSGEGGSDASNATRRGVKGKVDPVVAELRRTAAAQAKRVNWLEKQLVALQGRVLGLEGAVHGSGDDGK